MGRVLGSEQIVKQGAEVNQRLAQLSVLVCPLRARPEIACAAR